MAKIVMYSKDPCPYCVNAKRFFNSRNLEFKEIDLTNNQEAMDKIKAETGWRTFPIILINDQLIGGYTDLKDLETEGKLEALLKS